MGERIGLAVPFEGVPTRDHEWAAAADLADAVVIFGDPLPWWRLHALAHARGLPVRHYALPRPSPLPRIGPGGDPD